MDGQRIKLQGRNGEKVCVEGLLVVYIVKTKLFTELISLAWNSDNLKRFYDFIASY